MFLELTDYDDKTICINIDSIVAIKDYEGKALLYLTYNVFKSSNYITLKHSQREVINAIQSATGKEILKVDLS